MIMMFISDGMYLSFFKYARQCVLDVFQDFPVPLTKLPLNKDYLYMLCVGIGWLTLGWFG